jgi:hypothetical protein
VISVSCSSDSDNLSETSEIIKATLDGNVNGRIQVLSVFIVKPGEMRLNIERPGCPSSHRTEENMEKGLKNIQRMPMTYYFGDCWRVRSLLRRIHT